MPKSNMNWGCKVSLNEFRKSKSVCRIENLQLNFNKCVFLNSKKTRIRDNKKDLSLKGLFLKRLDLTTLMQLRQNHRNLLLSYLKKQLI